MSVSCKAYVCYGFLVKKAIKRVYITKYDGNTGKPYETPVNRLVAEVDGVEMEYNGISPEGHFDAIFEQFNFEDLEIAAGTDYEEVVVGRILAKTGDINYGGLISQVDMISEEDREKISSIASRYGVAPAYYLVPRCSY